MMGFHPVIDYSNSDAFALGDLPNGTGVKCL
jgi:hypothetical protein